MPFQVLKKRKKLSLGFDPKLFTNSSIEKNFKDSCDLFPLNQNLIDELKSINLNKYENKIFYQLKNKFAGETINSKINRLILNLNKQKIDNILLVNKKMLLGFLI